MPPQRGYGALDPRIQPLIDQKLKEKKIDELNKKVDDLIRKLKEKKIDELNKKVDDLIRNQDTLSMMMESEAYSVGRQLNEEITNIKSMIDATNTKFFGAMRDSKRDISDLQRGLARQKKRADTDEGNRSENALKMKEGLNKRFKDIDDGLETIRRSAAFTLGEEVKAITHRLDMLESKVKGGAGLTSGSSSRGTKRKNSRGKKTKKRKKTQKRRKTQKRKKTKKRKKSGVKRGGCGEK